MVTGKICQIDVILTIQYCKDHIPFPIGVSRDNGGQPITIFTRIFRIKAFINARVLRELLKRSLSLKVQTCIYKIVL